MKTFEINEDSLRKVWGGEGEYWFSLSDYKVKDAASLSTLDRPEHISQSAYFVSIGYIPYLFVTNEEVMRAYCDSIDNKKLRKAINNIDDSNYVESFWKYFNAYPDFAKGYESFEQQFAINKIVSWCNENEIDCKINL